MKLLSLLMLFAFCRCRCHVAAQDSKQPCATAGENNAFSAFRPFACGKVTRRRPKARPVRIFRRLPLFLAAAEREMACRWWFYPAAACEPVRRPRRPGHCLVVRRPWRYRLYLSNIALGSNGYLFPVPLYDARRAVQLVRARAADYHLDPHRIGMIGFSAGGHLAALALSSPLPARPRLPARLTAYRAGRIISFSGTRGSAPCRRIPHA